MPWRRELRDEMSWVRDGEMERESRVRDRERERELGSRSRDERDSRVGDQDSRSYGEERALR